MRLPCVYLSDFQVILLFFREYYVTLKAAADKQSLKPVYAYARSLCSQKTAHCSVHTFELFSLCKILIKSD